MYRFEKLLINILGLLIIAGRILKLSYNWLRYGKFDDV